MIRIRLAFAATSVLLAAFTFGCGGADPAAAPEAAPGTHIAYVGSYTRGEAQGISAYRFDSGSGDMTPIGLVAESPNPSFLAVHPNGRRLYAVNEGDPDSPSNGSISAFEIDSATGNLTFLNKVDSMGDGPCHIAVDKTGKFVFVANYGGGSVVSYRLQADGSLGDLASHIEHEGSSVHERQQAPHAHEAYVAPDNAYLFVLDLGMDKVMAYRINAETGELTANDPPFADMVPGAGPRHMEIAPDADYAYVLGEIDLTITTFAYDVAAGSFERLQVVSTLPAGSDAVGSTAEIEVSSDGRFVYGSNRGHDSIAVFAVDEADGTLTLVEHEPTQGGPPRNFVIDPTGAYLFAENQNSNTIVQFHRNAETGELTPTGQVSTDSPTPVCMVFVPIS